MKLNWDQQHRWFIGLSLVILVLAAGLRLYKLAEVPGSLYWDEVSTGYNAWSLLETGKDEYGTAWPVSIRSFDDYKPPLLTYLVMISIGVVGQSDLAVRLPIALLASLSVPIFQAISYLFYYKHKHRLVISLIAGLVMAVSPWHIHFSRAAFEASLALSLALLILLFLLLWYRRLYKPKLWLILSLSLASVSLYAYHSARLFIPLIGLVILAIWRKRFWSEKYSLILGLLLASLIAFPLVYTTIAYGSSLSRAANVNMFIAQAEFTSEAGRLQRNANFAAESFVDKWLHHRYLVLGKIWLGNYLDHFNFDFLFLEGDGNPRHQTYGTGLLYLFEIVPLVWGLYLLLAKAKPSDTKLIIIAWLLLAPIASSLTDDTPHTIRSTFMLPALLWLIILGWYQMFTLVEPWKFKTWFFPAVLVLIYTIGLSWYQLAYYGYPGSKGLADWQYGFRQAYAIASEYESITDQIIVSQPNDYPGLYYAWYQSFPPEEYQQIRGYEGKQIGKYQFQDQVKFDTEAVYVLGAKANKPDVNSKLDLVDLVTTPAGETTFEIYVSENLINDSTAPVSGD